MKDILYFLLLILSINLDCFASSVTEGFLIKSRSCKKFSQIGIAFGLVQALFFLLGFLGGKLSASWIASFDHWVAFFILLAIGVHMIIEEFRREKEKEGFSGDLRTLIGVAMAVSVDALAIGLVTSILLETLAVFVILVFILTFIISFTGVALGARFSKLASKIKYSQAIGGIILIFIGLKILLEHLGLF
uniref:Manganese efflux pump MntP n=1 Tax=candidate division WOR-3 bacterium TaxID=2052148 RepID=A0A7V3ZW73_UNCW3